MTFDDVLKKVGEFGPYQKKIYLFLCIPGISNAFFMMGHIFLLFTPDHRCMIPGLLNDTWEMQGPNHEHLINITIPPSESSLFQFDRCHIYVHKNDERNGSVDFQKEACSAWVYDKSVFYETFTSKHNLVCNDKQQTSMIQAIYFFGVLCGDLGFGMLADTIGRKRTFMITVLILSASSLATVWSPEIISFTVLEYINGAAMHAAFIIACVLSVEIVGPSKRVFVGIPIHMFFATGIIILTGFGYFIRTYKYIQLAIAIPCVFYISYWWIIPESPRWLISRKRFIEATEIITEIGHGNKKPFLESDVIFDKTSQMDETKGKLWNLFQSRVLCIRTVIILYNWLVISMMYYGVTMHARYLGGNYFLSFFIMAVVEYPANGSTIYLIERFGRKKIHCCCMIFGGFACLLTIFTVLYGGKNLAPLTLTLAVFGKMFSAAAFGVIYTFSSELYPTIVRNGGIGLSSCIARVGGMLAPYVAKSGEEIGGDFGRVFPLVIFGGVSVLAGCLSLVLPETVNRKLPETIEDAEKFGRKPLSTQGELHIVDKNEKNNLLYALS